MYVPGHPWLVIGKRADLFCGGDIVHAAFYVEKYRGGVSVNVVILKYGPVCTAETVLQLGFVDVLFGLESKESVLNVAI